MPDFIPNTTIYFARTGVTDTDKILCVDPNSEGNSTQEQLIALFKSSNMVQATREQYSFQRSDGYMVIRVDTGGYVDLLNYYNLCKCDSILYMNEEYNSSSFWVFGNITNVEWKNPDCSFVQFKIDYFMTFQHLVNWRDTYAFIERTHVKEDWSDAWNPMFSNIGPAEDFSVIPDTPLYFWFKNWDTDQVLIQSPYDDNGEPLFDGDLKGNLYSSLQLKAMRPAEANAYFKTIAEKEEASINNIVGVYGIPSIIGDSVAAGVYFGDGEEDIPAVNKMDTSANPVTYNNSKCWSSPFYTIRLMSSDGDVKDFTPQWFGNDVNDYRFIWRYGSSGGQFTGFEASFMNKNGTFDNWVGWKDYTVAIRQLPACPWTGDGFTDWQSRNGMQTGYNMLNSIIHNLTGFTNTFTGADAARKMSPDQQLIRKATAGINAVADTIGNVVDYVTTINNQKAAGTTVSSGGSFNALMDIAAGQWGFHIIVYGTQMYTMQSIDAYFDRFGYRINRIGRIGLKNRKNWTFIKTLDCHVKSNAIPFKAMNYINSMFNSGVTIWTYEAATDGQIGIGGFTREARLSNRGHPSLVP